MRRDTLVRRSSVVLCALAWALGCDGPITCPEGTELAGTECVAVDAGSEPDAATPEQDAAMPDMDAAMPAPDGGPMPMEDAGMPPPLPDAGPPTCSDPDTWYRDFDMDGQGDSSASVESCDPIDGFVMNADDCDDTCATCFDGAAETCDARDNDCDGVVDDGVTTAYYLDADGDGHGSASFVMNGCSMPAGYVAAADDCDDTCDVCWTGASESCDGEDNDCDGTSDEGVTTTYYLDADGDGRGDPTRTTPACSPPTGHVANSTDCDDGCSTCWTGAAEVCDTRDNDCEGGVDEGVTSTFYRDADGDGFGNSAMTSQACTAPSGYVAAGMDCDDACATCNPSGLEACDGLDNDCDATVDDGVRLTFYRDADGDGHGSAAMSMQACAMPSGFVTSSDDCNDGCATCYPGRAEVCDGLDNSCSGGADEGVTNTYYRDADGDGHGVTSDTRTACSAPSGYVAASGDCNDGSGVIHPGRTEVCNAVDDDCDGTRDETFSCERGAPVSCTTSCGSTGSGLCTSSCNLPAGGSCNPPTETCNGRDDDCDGIADENLFTEGTPLVTSYPVNFQRPKTVAYGSYLYSFWESAGTVSGWRLNRNGTPTSVAQIPIGAAESYDVDSGSGIALVYTDIPSGGSTGPVTVVRLSTNTLAPIWTRSLGVSAYDAQIAVGSTYAFVFTREGGGYTRRRRIRMSDGAIVGAAEVLGRGALAMDVSDDDGTRQLLAYVDVALGEVHVALMSGTSDTSLVSTRTYDAASIVWDVAVDSPWVGSNPDVVVAYAERSSDLASFATRYVSWHGSTRYLGLISTSSTTAHTGAGQSAISLQYADGIYLLGTMRQRTSISATTGMPFAYQLTTRPTSGYLDVRGIDLGLPYGEQEHISVVRFPDSVPYPDRLFYNPSVNGIASIPIGCD